MNVKKAGSFFKEFKTFINRESALDLAIGVVFGAAFSQVVSSLATDLFVPSIGYLAGQMDFSKFQWVLKETSEEGGSIVINYGILVNNIINFLIVSFSVFLVIKALGRSRRAKRVEPTTQKCAECALEIPLEAKRCGHCGQLIKIQNM